MRCIGVPKYPSSRLSAEGSKEQHVIFQMATLIQDSIVDGPGLRLAVFCQGCPHRCEGCHNPEALDPAGGTTGTTEQVVELMAKNPLCAGVTLTGGEPFMQAEAMAELARAAHACGRNVVTYTGYRLETLLAGLDETPGWRALLENSDWLVEGPFDLENRTLGLPWRGSTNQRVLNAPQSVAQGCAVEVEDVHRVDRSNQAEQTATAAAPASPTSAQAAAQPVNATEPCE